METILFNNHGISPGIRLTKSLKDFLVSIFRYEKIPIKNISYVFCTDDYLLSLNQQFLDHNILTDILTFTLSDSGDPVESEIYISIERVRENADFFNTDYRQEFLRVIIHGILHLCGYSDHTKQEKALIRKKENYYLAKLGST